MYPGRSEAMGWPVTFEFFREEREVIEYKYF